MKLRRRNKLWQADIVTADGRRVRKSFGTKAEAASFAASLTPTHAEPERRSASIASAIARYVGKAPSGRSMAAKALIAEAGSLSPRLLTPALVAAACDSFRARKPTTRQCYHAAMRHLISNMRAPADCLGGIPAVISPDSPTKIVTDAEFELVLKHADMATGMCLLLCREAALRAGTAYSLTPAHFIDGHVRAVTKNEGAIVVPLSARALALAHGAAHFVGKDEPIWFGLGIHRGTNIGNTLRHRLAALQAGLDVSQWTWHDLRRTAAQRLYERTHDLHVVQSLLGHKSIACTLHYLNAQRPTLGAVHLAHLVPSAHPDVIAEVAG